jgi:ubiquitin C-terminal hydrolase
MKSSELQTRNVLTKSLWQVIAAAQSGSDVANLSPVIWQAFMRRIRELDDAFWQQKNEDEKTKRRPLVFGQSQEDANESIVKFVDALDSPEIEQLFEHRYRHTVTCEACKFEKEIAPDEGIMIEFSLAEIKAAGADIQQMIKKQNPEMDTSYKCIKCKSDGQKTKLSKLTMTPEILILLFKKYDAKWSVDVPEFLEIPSSTGSSHKYRLVACNEHAGGMSGGHYWAHALRSDSVYRLDDTSVTRVDNLKSSMSTYMVWYHAF